jgi:hypothetical protein
MSPPGDQAQAIEFQATSYPSSSYKGIGLNCGYRLDLIVEDRIIVEVKVN